MQHLLQAGHPDESQANLITLGLNHEQQHQELLLTDIKHVFSFNPIQPPVSRSLESAPTASVAPYSYTRGESGIRQFGANGDGFAFDNETPRHDALLHEHQVGDRLVTNGEYRDFIKDGAYRNSELWLSDGWATINEHDWQRPLYWDEDLDSEFTLGGRLNIDPNAPVCHVSYYEADAFARWACTRLPTEFEWEAAASRHRVEGNLLAGSLGEYNGKFMCNQMTVRGGSCVTAQDHIRGSYRSFFYADARWQFLGIRLAKDQGARRHRVS